MYVGDLTHIHNDKLGELIDEMVQKGSITEKTGKFLHVPNPRTPGFYCLPKIHKPQRPPPGRPICSASGGPLERASGFVDHFLSDYVPQTKSYLKDTNDFLQKIDQLGEIPDDTLIVSFDVTSLYTNIPAHEALRVAHNTLRDNRHGSLKPHNSELVRMLCMVLKNNNFEFNGEHYLQTSGVAMGTRVAPTIANLVMDNFEKLHVYTYHKQPLVWWRFIDDVFSLWTHGRSALYDFLDHLNSVHRTIKFTMEVSNARGNFLDCTVIKENNKLYTTLFTKPTDTHMYLNFQSCHPYHTKSGGPYSQLLRVKRICSKESDFTKESNLLISHYQRRGYPKKVLTKALNQVATKSRQDLLYPVARTATDSSQNKLFCIVKYHPSNPPLQKIFKQYWNILSSARDLNCVSEKEVIVGLKRGKNLRDHLVHSKLKPIKHNNPSTSINQEKVCKSKDCRYCNKLDISGKVISNSTGYRYSIPQRITCRFNNLVYIITCRKCNLQYVGETKQMLQRRLYQHLKDIERGAKNNTPPTWWKPTSVSRHFNLPYHSEDDVKIQVLELIPFNKDKDTTDVYRGIREHHWIHQMRTIEPNGLNVQMEKTYKRN